MYVIIKEFRREKQEKYKKSRTGFRIIKEKMIQLKCDKCYKIHERTLLHYNKMKIRFIEFNKDYCNKCWRPILNNRPGKIEKMRAGLKKVWSNPKKRQEQSIIMKKRSQETGYMIGDNNPMKNKETRLKVGKTRSAGMTSEVRKMYSEAIKKAWAEGKYIGKKTTQCKWYHYIDQWNNNHRCQGTWELKFAKYLDDNNIIFMSHIGKISYTDDKNISHNYFPDFFVPKWNCYVDVKATYWLIRQKRKFELLKEQSNENILILTEKELIEKGINIYDYGKNN